MKSRAYQRSQLGFGIWRGSELVIGVVWRVRFIVYITSIDIQGIIN